MASILTKKANTQDQSAALMYLPSQSRSKIVAANQICIVMNATKNEAPAIVKQKIENRISITPLLALSVSVRTCASAQRFLVRKLDAVEDSCTRLVSSDLHSMADGAEIIGEALRGAFRHYACRREIVAWLTP
jgi:hypothetical protein